MQKITFSKEKVIALKWKKISNIHIPIVLYVRIKY